MKIPKTKPKWTTGQFALCRDGELQGYFRTFIGAWHWRNYLLAAASAGTRFAIQHKGSVVNVIIKEGT